MSTVVTVFNGSSNREVLKVKPIGGNADGLSLIDGIYIDMGAPSIEKVVFAAGGKHISSETDSIDIVGGHLEIEFGDLELEGPEEREGVLLVYIVGEPEPVVIAGPGLEESIVLKVKSIPAIQ